jgi:hypothetical protein
MNQSADGLGIMLGAHFFGSSGHAQLHWRLCERLSCTGHHECVRVMCIKFLLQGVH